MKQELKDNLLEYLGELMYDLDNTDEHFTRSSIRDKIDACNTLLPIKCKHIKREGESCTLNNNCTYPNCK